MNDVERAHEAAQRHHRHQILDPGAPSVPEHGDMAGTHPGHVRGERLVGRSRAHHRGAMSRGNCRFGQHPHARGDAAIDGLVHDQYVQSCVGAHLIGAMGVLRRPGRLPEVASMLLDGVSA